MRNRLATRYGGALLLSAALVGCGGGGGDTGAGTQEPPAATATDGATDAATESPTETATETETTSPEPGEAESPTAGATATAGAGATEAPDADVSEGGTVEVVETSFDIFLADGQGRNEPLTLTIPAPGTYTFDVTNEASLVHALTIEGHGLRAETGNIPGGESTTLEVTFDQAGEYELYCPVGNHRELGMDGSVQVLEG